nr:MAG TPA: hypothetical protein [Caudoviricetes sp.]
MLPCGLILTARTALHGPIGGDLDPVGPVLQDAASTRLIRLHQYPHGLTPHRSLGGGSGGL